MAPQNAQEYSMAIEWRLPFSLPPIVSAPPRHFPLPFHIYPSADWLLCLSPCWPYSLWWMLWWLLVNNGWGGGTWSCGGPFGGEGKQRRTPAATGLKGGTAAGHGEEQWCGPLATTNERLLMMGLANWMLRMADVVFAPKGRRATGGRNWRKLKWGRIGMRGINEIKEELVWFNEGRIRRKMFYGRICFLEPYYIFRKNIVFSGKF